MSIIVNTVQDSLSDYDVETGFTAVRSTQEFDEECLNDNQSSRQRHNEIRQDFNFNDRLDRRGDTQIKRRTEKARLAQKVCSAQSIKVSTDMVIRIHPADTAGDALRALADAGTTQARLFGYDFKDYDILYQQAADKAVSLAKRKAEMIAHRSGASLGELESLIISRPAQTGRFGPQPNVIRSANRYNGQTGSVVERQTHKRGQPKLPAHRNKTRPPAPTFTCWNGKVVFYLSHCPDQPINGTSTQGGSIGEVIVAGSSPITRGQFTVFNGVSNQVVQSTQTVINNAGEILCRVTIPPKYKTVTKQLIKTPARTVERHVPAVTKDIIVKSANPDGSYKEVVKTITVKEAYTDIDVIPAEYEPRTEQILVEPGRVEWKPASQAINAGEFKAVKFPKGQSETLKNAPTTNALSMSLLSGPKTISVTANLSYDYETPLNGKFIIKDEG